MLVKLKPFPPLQVPQQRVQLLMVVQPEDHLPLQNLSLKYKTGDLRLKEQSIINFTKPLVKLFL